MQQPMPDPGTVIRVAAVADLSLGTVRRFFGGHPIRPRSLARIRTALLRLGLVSRVDLDPQPEAASGRRA